MDTYIRVKYSISRFCTLAGMRDEYKLKDGKEVGWWATHEKVSSN